MVQRHIGATVDRKKGVHLHKTSLRLFSEKIARKKLRNVDINSFLVRSRKFQKLSISSLFYLHWTEQAIVLGTLALGTSVVSTEMLS